MSFRLAFSYLLEAIFLLAILDDTLTKRVSLRVGSEVVAYWFQEAVDLACKSDLEIEGIDVFLSVRGQEFFVSMELWRNKRRHYKTEKNLNFEKIFPERTS